MSLVIFISLIEIKITSDIKLVFNSSNIGTIYRTAQNGTYNITKGIIYCNHDTEGA